MKPSAQRVLNRLRQGPATTHDFLSDGCGSRFGARIAELRALGFRISEERLPLPARGSRYRLVAESRDFPSGRIPPRTDDSTGVALPASGDHDAAESALGNRAVTSAKEIPDDRHAGEGLFDVRLFTQRDGYETAA